VYLNASRIPIGRFVYLNIATGGTRHHLRTVLVIHFLRLVTDDTIVSISSYCRNARPPGLFAQVAVWVGVGSRIASSVHLGGVWRHDAGRVLVRARSCTPCYISFQNFAVFSNLRPNLRDDPAPPHFTIQSMLLMGCCRAEVF
jgi:hypothetical protein